MPKLFLDGRNKSGLLIVVHLGHVQNTHWTTINAGVSLWFSMAKTGHAHPDAQVIRELVFNPYAAAKPLSIVGVIWLLRYGLGKYLFHGVIHCNAKKITPAQPG